jgi:hypothetical protein
MKTLISWVELGRVIPVATAVLVWILAKTHYVLMVISLHTGMELGLELGM